MQAVVVRAEMERLLADAPLGGLSALARHVGVQPASVSAWKHGQSVPDIDWWTAIEQFLGLPDGHIARAAAGIVDGSVEPIWPMIESANAKRRVSRRDDDLAQLRQQIADMNLDLRGLGDTVQALADEVAQLRERRREADGG